MWNLTTAVFPPFMISSFHIKGLNLKFFSLFKKLLKHHPTHIDMGKYNIHLPCEFQKPLKSPTLIIAN